MNHQINFLFSRLAQPVHHTTFERHRMLIESPVSPPHRRTTRPDQIPPLRQHGAQDGGELPPVLHWRAQSPQRPRARLQGQQVPQSGMSTSQYSGPFALAMPSPFRRIFSADTDAHTITDQEFHGAGRRLPELGRDGLDVDLQ